MGWSSLNCLGVFQFYPRRHWAPAAWRTCQRVSWSRRGRRPSAPGRRPRARSAGGLRAPRPWSSARPGWWRGGTPDWEGLDTPVTKMNFSINIYFPIKLCYVYQVPKHINSRVASSESHHFGSELGEIRPGCLLHRPGTGWRSEDGLQLTINIIWTPRNTCNDTIWVLSADLTNHDPELSMTFQWFTRINPYTCDSHLLH